MKEIKKDCGCKIPEDMNGRVGDVLKDNQGRPYSGKVTPQEVTAELEELNPDENSLDSRG